MGRPTNNEWMPFAGLLNNYGTNVEVLVSDLKEGCETTLGMMNVTDDDIDHFIRRCCLMGGAVIHRVKADRSTIYSYIVRVSPVVPVVPVVSEQTPKRQKRNAEETLNFLNKIMSANV